MLFIIELLLFGRGLLALIRGRMNLVKKGRVLEGNAARAAGGVLMLPFLLGVGATTAIEILVRLGMLTPYVRGPALIIENVFVISTPFLALIVGKAVQKKQTPSLADASYTVTDNPPAAF